MFYIAGEVGYTVLVVLIALKPVPHNEGISVLVPSSVSDVELNDLVRGLKLFTEKAELIGSQLSRMEHMSRWHNDFSFWFTSYCNDSIRWRIAICLCIDVNCRMRELGYEHQPYEWRLFY